MAFTVESHIYLILTCDCGHEWDIEDYSNLSVPAAEDAAREQKCPECGKEVDDEQDNLAE